MTAFPNHWTKVALGNLCEVKYGKALGSDDRKGEGTIPVFGSGGIVGYHNESLANGPSIVIGRKGSVGSIYYSEGPFWAIDTAFYVDGVSPFVALPFLAAALEFFGLDRYRIVAGVPGINRDALKSFKVPLPPLSEQQRIVEILQETEQVRRLRTQAETKTAELIPAIFTGLFGNLVTNSKGWPVVPVSKFVDRFEGGKSLPDEGSDVPGRARVLKISAVTSGTFDPNESKSVPSGYEPQEHHFVKPGDLLISRANTEELVGATAYVENCPPDILLSDKLWRFVWSNPAETSVVFMSALFRDRGVRQKISRLATGTGGSMKNISMEKLMRMRVPLPPFELQRQFEVASLEVKAMQRASSTGNLNLKLSSALLAHAFTGELTAEWREKHQKKLELEAKDRDEALKASGVSLTRRATVSEVEAIFARRTDGAYAELTREQHEVLEAAHKGYGGVDYPRWFTGEQVAKRLTGPMHGNLNVVMAHLAVLVARGLVIAVSREEENEKTGEIIYGNAFRLPLRDRADNLTDQQGNQLTTQAGDEIVVPVAGDKARLREMQRLVGQLEKERML